MTDNIDTSSNFWLATQVLIFKINVVHSQTRDKIRPTITLDSFLFLMNLFKALTLDQLDKLTKILGILVGGVAAYYKFFKGRVHVSRLELKVSGAVICKDNVSYLFTTASVKNIGLSKVDINHHDSGLLITSCKPLVNVTGAQMVDWREPSIFNVFEDDPWIEPGETVEEKYLIAIPGCNREHFAYRLQLLIVSDNAFWQVNGIAQWQVANNLSKWAGE